MKNLWKAFLNDESDQFIIQDIQRMLNDELKKPAAKRDYDQIAELTKAYSEIMGEEDNIEEAMERCFSAIRNKTKHRKITRKMRRIVLTAACIAVSLLALNAVTVTAWDINLFSLFVHIDGESFSVEPPYKPVDSADIIILPTSPEDPYGMIAECAKYDIYPETPHCLPEQFVLTVAEYTDVQGAVFTFMNSKNTDQWITFSYQTDKNNTNQAEFSDSHYLISTVEVNGKSAVLSEKRNDKQFTMVYSVEGTFSSVMVTQDMSRQELDMVISSIY